ncbi:hypothetical protein ASC75_23685 [Aminobacter sp. DSM 101952]|nr:hypothetical protein ASC75_23685 [Aminobacter sp. DSM 101952]
MHFTQSNTPLLPQDVELLQTVFDRVCDERGEDPSSVWANAIARTLIAVYQAGVRDEELLVAVIPGRKLKKEFYAGSLKMR